ncbi:ribonuclease E/G [Roseococcus thiosulfatophilus]|uniref:ribonuclease E/G n=1 Tax=Roseococcus thiosulfatophilus TaxID=35813 RepID=UPI001A8D1EBD|nr:ribonuclease E/G [Roseococcus thiosulfatophilus]
MAAPLIEIRVSRAPGERRVALLRDGRLEGFRLERPARPDGVGDVVRGRVVAVMPALSGAFVELPGGDTGFLPANETEGRRLPPEGTRLALRILRAAQGGKGARVSARVPDLPGEGVLARGPDQALRWAAQFPEARVLADSPAELARLRPLLGARAALAPPFDDALEAEIEALHGPEVVLDGGGRLIISPLPALTAVDVDSGGADPAAVNARAIPEFARQMRLRDLAGPILLDVAGLTARQRAGLEPALRAALGADPLVQYLGLGPLGLFEMRRTRIHPPLHEVLADRALAHGLALLRQAAREAAAAPARRMALHAPAPVLAALRALPGALEEYAEAARHALTLREAATAEVTDA